MANWKRTLKYLRALLIRLWNDFLHSSWDSRASSLAFSTLLSLVPLLALSFSVLKAFGVHNQIEPLLKTLLQPLAEQSVAVVEHLVTIVDGMQVGVLGATGLVMLIYTVFSLIKKIESAFNETWHVSAARQLSHAFRDFLSVLLLGPLLLFALLGIGASVLNTLLAQPLAQLPVVDDVLTQVLEYTPSLMIMLSLTFMYRFIPNTPVQTRPAFIAALITLLLWKLASWGFTTFVVHLGTQTAVYSVFAGLFLSIFWLYVAWVIILLGSSIAYYLQNPNAIPIYNHTLTPSLETQQRLLLGILQEVLQAFEQQRPLPTRIMLSEALQVPDTLLQPLLQQLVEQEVLIRDDATPAHYLPHMPPTQLTTTRLWDVLWTGTQLQQQQTKQLLVQSPIPIAWGHYAFMTQQEESVKKLLGLEADKA